MKGLETYKLIASIHIFLCRIIKLLWSHSKEIFVALMTRTDKDGNTPFHLCCKNGHAGVVQEFLAILEEDGVFKDANRLVAALNNQLLIVSESMILT